MKEVNKKYDAMVDAIAQYVDAEIKEHRSLPNIDCSDVVADDMYFIEGYQLIGLMSGTLTMSEVFGDE